MYYKEHNVFARNILAELQQICMDSEFISEYSELGFFQKRNVSGKDYWYHINKLTEKTTTKYVGPDSDPEIKKRVEAFSELKANSKKRTEIVKALVHGYNIPSFPDHKSAQILHAFWKAGLFRRRACVVGTVAFLNYENYFGLFFENFRMRTNDVDFAQFHSISVSIEDNMEHPLEILKQLDNTYKDVPNLTKSNPTRFVNQDAFKVEFISPNNSKDEYTGHPTPLPSLSIHAENMRFLDFLIAETVRVPVLYKSGLVVNVPSPERFAIHKIIVSARRLNDANGKVKSEKDLLQTEILLRALKQKQDLPTLAMAFDEAWNNGPSWKKHLFEGMRRMDRESLSIIIEAIETYEKEYELEVDLAEIKKIFDLKPEALSLIKI